MSNLSDNFFFKKQTKLAVTVLAYLSPFPSWGFSKKSLPCKTARVFGQRAAQTVTRSNFVGAPPPPNATIR